MRREDKQLRPIYRKIARVGVAYRRLWKELTEKQIDKLTEDQMNSIWVEPLWTLIEKEIPKTLLYIH
jgi:hypothetical protein